MKYDDDDDKDNDIHYDDNDKDYDTNAVYDDVSPATIQPGVTWLWTRTFPGV